MSAPYRAAVVGCGMGRAHASVLAALEDYELVAVCDLDEEVARKTAARTGGPAVYTDYGVMLAQEKPEVVAVATPTALHAPQTLEALRAGARGVCLEKPMAVNLGEARAVMIACQERGASLIVNHQRRLQPDLTAARRLIEEGALGEVTLLRGQCAGDLLSDGTHLLDSLLWLCGDPEAEWVLGQAHRDFPEALLYGHTRPGWRYGHRVEAGALGVVQLAGGRRIEVFCGDLRERGLAYQDYQVFGSLGRLWRVGDSGEPNLFIADGRPGGFAAGWEEGSYRPLPREGGPWRPVPGTRASGGMEESYRRFARTLESGEPHPLSGENSLRSFEMLMALLESARLRRKMTLPLAQEAYPLDLMAEDQVSEEVKR